MIACDPTGALWHPSGPMGPPSDLKEPGAGAESLHSGPARRTWALVGLCARALRKAMCPEPARAPPWLPAARQVPMGLLGTAPPRAGPERAVSAPAGARGVPAGRWGPKTRFGPVAACLGRLGAVPRRFGHPLRSIWWAPENRVAGESSEIRPTCRLRAHRAAEGRAHDPTSARVWRAGPLCEILGSAPGSLRSVGGPIGPLGCQRAPAGSPANARKPPRQRPKMHREFCPVH